MTWQSVDNQAQLDALDAQVAWEDAEVLEYHAGLGDRPHADGATRLRAARLLHRWVENAPRDGTYYWQQA